jgi:hypothetical protein
VGDGVAGGGQAAVAGLVLAEGDSALMAVPAIELDELGGPRPVAVDLVALVARLDPVVVAG